jgi:lysophospholipase L1-like esterase
MTPTFQRLRIAAFLAAAVGTSLLLTVPAAGKSAAEQQAEKRLHEDWADLARFREANARLGPPRSGERRVVFYGDSIMEVWAPYFATMFPGKPYIGRGISGQTTPQLLVRFRQDVIALRPAAVVLLAGTNDLAGNTGPTTLAMIEDNLESMIELARAHEIRVVLASVLPVYDYFWRPGLHPAAKVVALDQWMQRYAADHHVVYLDFYPALADQRGGFRQELSDDGVHPNAAGFRVMGPLAERAIEQALASGAASGRLPPTRNSTLRGDPGGPR